MSVPQFESWLKKQPFYGKLMFIHGERLFIRENGEYKIFAIAVAYSAFVHQAQKQSDDTKSKNSCDTSKQKQAVPEYVAPPPLVYYWAP